MTKKALIVMVAAVLLLTAVPALAATPSKTTDDLTRILKVQSEDGRAGESLIYIRTEPTDFANETLDALQKYKSKSNSIVDFFSSETQESILKLLPENTDLKKMIISEFASLGIGEYLESYGDVTCTFQFPTEYNVKSPAVALMGYLDAAGTTVWVPLQTEVIEGKLTIVFPTEALLIAGHDVVLTILSI